MIRVSAFQPFESRQGVDTVLALRFQYDPELIESLKLALRRASYLKYIKNPGGWLAEHRCWFVEREAWPIVQEHLRADGYAYISSPEVDEPPRTNSGALDVRNTVKTWYREMAMKYHPDRRLDNGAAMAAINDSYDRLQELLGIAR
jgi:hypothetical protein